MDKKKFVWSKSNIKKSRKVLHNIKNSLDEQVWTPESLKAPLPEKETLNCIDYDAMIEDFLNIVTFKTFCQKQNNGKNRKNGINQTKKRKSIFYECWSLLIELLISCIA